MTLWLVRAGKYGEREEFSLNNNISTIGWNIYQDLSQIDTVEALKNVVAERYPDSKENTILNWAYQIWNFVNNIQEGDLIALPMNIRSVVAVGIVKGPYQYQSTNPEGAKHTRPVEWKKEIARSRIDQDLLYSLGATQTISRPRANNAEQRMKRFIENDFSSVDKDDDNVELDIEQLAKDQILQAIKAKFKGHGLTRLTAAILEAQGYTVFTSPEGPDGGVDILAGKGILGSEQPRIAVQVKSSDEPVDVRVFRELKGIISTFNANIGLIVSLSGFKPNVIQEARKSYFEVRLWDDSDLIRLIQENYEVLGGDIKADLPLKPIWLLVPEDEAT